MDHRCPPTQYTRLTFAVERPGAGVFTLVAAHYHPLDLAPCSTELYGPLSWSELLDLVLTICEERRPGTSPAGWEQLQFPSAPALRSSPWDGAISEPGI